MNISLPHISRFILWSAIGFICGVGVASFWHLQMESFLFVVSVFSVIIGIIFYAQKWSWIMVTALLFCALGVMVVQKSVARIAHMAHDAGAMREGAARIIDDVRTKEWHSIVVAQFDDAVHTTVLIKDDKYSDLRRGDVIALRCRTMVPENYNQFDYRMYLAMKGIDYICADVTYHVITHEDDFLTILARARAYMENIVNSIIPAPQSALANGLLFGGSDRLPSHLAQDFSLTGMTHIVAVSGYNVSIIVATVIGALIFCGLYRKHAVVGAMIAVFLFVALIGFPASGVRAAIMGTLVLVAAAYGRVTHAYGAIFTAAALMLIFNPLLLRYDVGFQLSFLATLGIVAVYPLLEKYFVSKKTAFGIVDIILVTLSAQIFVLPIIAYHFQALSLLSLLANVLVLPIIPATMLFVFLMIVTSFLFLPAAFFFGWIAHFLLSYEIFVIQTLAEVPWNHIPVTHVSVFFFLVYYGLIGIVVFVLNKKHAYVY